MFPRISAFYFFFFASVGVYIIFLPKILSDLGYTPAQIGVVFAVAPVMRFLTPFLFLKFIALDRKVYKIALAGNAIGILLVTAVLEHFWLLLAAFAFFGTFWSLMLPYVEVLALEHIKEKYGRARLYGSIGFTLIGLILGQTALELGISLTAYIGSVFATVGAAALLLPHIEAKEAPSEHGGNFSIRRHWPFWLSIFLVQVGFGGFYNFFTIFETEHGVPLHLVSYLWAWGVIAEIGMFIVQHYFLKWPLLLLIRFSIFLTIVRWGLLDRFSDSLATAFFTQTFHAFSLALLHTASIHYINKVYANRRLGQQFYLGITFGLGMFTGSLLSGPLYGENLFGWMALITVGAFLFSLLEKEEKTV